MMPRPNRTLLLLLGLLIQFASAFVPLLQHGSPFFRSQPLSFSNNNNNMQFANGDNDTPYVPSGLTREEYEQIKQREADKIRSMNYGAWGPRFQRQSGAPNGDWLVMPQLWTQGFESNRQMEMNGGLKRQDVLWTRFRQLLPYFAVAYFAVELVLALIVSLRTATRSQTLAAAWMLPLRCLLRLQSGFLTMSWLRSILIKSTLAGLVVTPMVRACVEYASRRRLWTPRRVLVLSAVTMTGLACAGSFVVTAALRII